MTRPLGIVLLSVLSLTPCLGQLRLRFSDQITWKQSDQLILDHEGGGLYVTFCDGTLLLSSCDFAPASVVVQPNSLCPLGTTAFIAEGDLTGNREDDGLTFWSAAAVSPPATIEPFRSDLFKMTSAPASGIVDILRATDGDLSAVFTIEDMSIVVWYNFITNPGSPERFDLVKVYLDREYGPGNTELARHFYDVPWGTYAFTVPSLGDPDLPIPLRAEMFISPDGYPGRGVNPQGWRLTNNQWKDGKLPIDPRLPFNLASEGIDRGNALEEDELYFSLRANHWIDLSGNERVGIDLPPAGEVATDPDTETSLLKQDVIVYPNYAFDVPAEDRAPQKLSSPYIDEVTLSDTIRSIGDSATGFLEFRRDRTVIELLEATRRTLKFDLCFVDTFTGFAKFGTPNEGGFPLETPEEQRRPNLDYDCDGCSNLLEFLLMTDLADPGSSPPKLIQGTRDDITDLCSFTISKRPFVDGVDCIVQVSLDGNTWSTITSGDPDWTIVDSGGQLTVTSTAPKPECYFRVVPSLGGSDFDGDGLSNTAEQGAGTDPYNPDSDGDGQGDGFELLQGFDPLVADQDYNGIPDGKQDFDGDGMPGWEEEARGTSILVKDSDGDQIPDVAELLLTKTDPFDPDTDGDGTPDGEEDADVDGYTNYQEVILLLTDPLSGCSCFQLKIDTALASHSASFNTHSGRLYTLEKSTDLRNWEQVIIVKGSDGVIDIPLGEPSTPSCYYRVRVDMPRQ